jgi:hypothetical protein
VLTVQLTTLDARTNALSPTSFLWSNPVCASLINKYTTSTTSANRPPPGSRNSLDIEKSSALSGQHGALLVVGCSCPERAGALMAEGQRSCISHNHYNNKQQTKRTVYQCGQQPAPITDFTEADRGAAEVAALPTLIPIANGILPGG